MGLTVDVAEIVRCLRDSPAVRVAGAGTRAVTAIGPVPPVDVSAPSGILEFQPDEMTIRVRAGTRLEELRAALAEHGQYANLSGRGTVGGALADGSDDVYALGRGRCRDVLLGARFVDGLGREIVAGGPTVKNVSGFDLCRLLVGSRGVIGVVVDVVLRTRPRPLATSWFRCGMSEPDEVRNLQISLYRPSSLLWDGATLWVCLEGHPDDVDEQRRRHLTDFVEVDGPPGLDGRRRVRHAADRVESLVDGDTIVELGLGVIHSRTAFDEPVADESSRRIARRLKSAFDPSNRLNPHLGGDWSR